MRRERSERGEMRVEFSLLIVDTWWTKKDPFAAVFEGEVVPSTLTLTSTSTSTLITAGGD